MAVAAKMIGVTRVHANVIWSRPGSKRYSELIECLEKIIDAREKLVKREESSKQSRRFLDV
ncbi:hypothetical protein [Marinilabilia rubra]|nr:hypothetical protein [Marinilabilia rubra]